MDGLGKKNRITAAEVSESASLPFKCSDPYCFRLVGKTTSSLSSSVSPQVVVAFACFGFVCVCECECKPVCVVHGWYVFMTMSIEAVFLSFPLVFFPLAFVFQGKVSCWDPEHTRLVRLAGQQAPGISLSLLPSSQSLSVCCHHV